MTATGLTELLGGVGLSVSTLTHLTDAGRLGPGLDARVPCPHEHS